MSSRHQPEPPVSRAGADDAAWDSARRQIGDGRLSIVMPAFNLGPAILDNVRHVHSIFSGRLPFEIVVVDDGSADDTADQLRRASEEVSELTPVYLPENMGKGEALRRGFEASTGTFVLLLDGDLDLPPRQVSRFFDIMESSKADGVIGSKLHPDSIVDAYPWQRKLISLCYYRLVKALVGLPVRDTQTGIKLFRRPALEYAFPRLLVKRFAFDLELLSVVHEKGFRIAESPITLRSEGRWGMPTSTTVRQILNDTLAVFYRVRVLHYYTSIRETRMPAPPPRVSVVIAFPAASDYLDECLAGLAHQTHTDFEVLLLPDEPTGRSWPDHVRELPTGKRRPAEKRNIGIREARGSIVAFLDDDAFPDHNWLERAIVYFSIPEVAAVGGPGVTPPKDPFLARLGGSVFAHPFVSGGYRYRYQPTRVQEVDDFPSCNLFVRKATLDKVGGFRTDFWPGEDTYLCLQIVGELAMKIFYDPRVVVFHHRRPLFLPHLRQVARYALHRGYFARHFPLNSRKLSYALPSLFVAGLAAGPLACLAWPALWPLYAGALIVYGAAMLVPSFHSDPAAWALVCAGAVATHLVYGVRFVGGWFSPRMPSRAERFDHPSEAVEASP